jgi:hypothetical protein
MFWYAEELKTQICVFDITLHNRECLFSRLPLHLLHLVHEVEVGLIKVMDTDVTVLTTGCVAGSLGVARNSVERTEMASDTSDLIFKDFVVESSLKLSLSGRCGCDITRLLATPENDEVLLRRDGTGVEGGIGNVGLEDLEGVCLDELSKH